MKKLPTPGHHLCQESSVFDSCLFSLPSQPPYFLFLCASCKETPFQWKLLSPLRMFVEQSWSWAATSEIFPNPYPPFFGFRHKNFFGSQLTVPESRSWQHWVFLPSLTLKIKVLALPWKWMKAVYNRSPPFPPVNALALLDFIVLFDRKRGGSFKSLRNCFISNGWSWSLVFFRSYTAQLIQLLVMLLLLLQMCYPCFLKKHILNVAVRNPQRCHLVMSEQTGFHVAKELYGQYLRSSAPVFFHLVCTEVFKGWHLQGFNCHDLSLCPLYIVFYFEGPCLVFLCCLSCYYLMCPTCVPSVPIALCWSVCVFS